MQNCICSLQNQHSTAYLEGHLHSEVQLWSYLKAFEMVKVRRVRYFLRRYQAAPGFEHQSVPLSHLRYFSSTLQCSPLTGQMSEPWDWMPREGII